MSIGHATDGLKLLAPTIGASGRFRNFRFVARVLLGKTFAKHFGVTKLR